MAGSILDANVVLRWLLNDVPKQAAAVQRFVLDRTLGLSRDLVADYLDAVLALAQIQIDRKIWGAAVSTYRTHPKLSVADCYLTALATSTGETPLHTFDAKLARQLQGAELLR